MAGIFVSYTSSDRDWAHWIGKELKALGHTPHVHEWEIKGGDDIYGWMEGRHDAADHVLCVVSDEYLKAPYSTLERNAALWQAASKRPGFVLLVAVKPCRFPTLTDHLRRCELYGIPDDQKRQRFHQFMSKRATPSNIVLPGAYAVSNIPIRVPALFMGRDDALEAIDTALKRYEGRVAITALHGLRGVGKTTLAAAYAERHRSDYRATWWIRAQTEPTMRADLVALGVRLNWVAADEKEELALAAITERLRHEGEGILLLYDNAVDANTLKPYLPPGGRAQVLVTSTAHAWRGVASPVEIRLWPKEIGADYLIARTGRATERNAALALSEALGGLPLAHEQAAAYCERLGIALGEYARRFGTAPAKFLDDTRNAPTEYHDGLTVAKTFALAIDEAAKLHPAAEPLIVHAALLAPEAIPLFLFSEARDKFGEPLASALGARGADAGVPRRARRRRWHPSTIWSLARRLYVAAPGSAVRAQRHGDVARDGLDEAVAALRTFALVERETIVDERDPSIRTDCIRLHRLVRQVAAQRCDNEVRTSIQRTLIECVAVVYPANLSRDPHTWSRVRRLDAVTLGLIRDDFVPLGSEKTTGDLLRLSGQYRHYVLADYAMAKALFESALMIRENVLGADHPDTATSLNDLALLLQAQGNFSQARQVFERALLARRRLLGDRHPDTAQSCNDLAMLHTAQGNLSAALSLCNRALMIREKMLGPDHPDTAQSLGNLAVLLGLSEPMTRDKSHPGLDDPAGLARLAEDRMLMKVRALTIHERVYGPDHPNTATSLDNLALLLQAQGDHDGALRFCKRALEIREKLLGSEHPETATSLDNLALLLRAQRDDDAALMLCQRAFAVYKKVLGFEHPITNRSRSSLASLLLGCGSIGEALMHAKSALASHDKVLGPKHPWTKDSVRVTADALDALSRTDEAAALRERYGITQEQMLPPN